MFCLMYLLSYNPDSCPQIGFESHLRHRNRTTTIYQKPYKIVITLLLFLIATPSNRAVMVELHVA